MSGAGRFVAANVVDSLGTGLVLAFTVVYFVSTTPLSLAVIGAALTTGHLLALPAPALAGVLMDRYGPRAVVVSANLVSAAGFAGALFADSAWHVGAVYAAIQTGINLYWTASRSLVALAAAPDQQRLWFGFLGALRNVGLGAGAAVASVVLAAAGSGGLRVLVAVNAVTFVCAAFLFGTWRPAGRGGDAEAGAPEPKDSPSTGGSWRDVLRDRRYLLLVATNLAFVFAQMVPSVLLAVYITESLHAGAWIAGALLVVNTAAVALTSTLVTRRAQRYAPHRVIAVAFALSGGSFVLFAALTGAPGRLVAAGLLLAVLVFTLGEILCSPALNELSVTLAPARLQGRHQAAFQFSWSAGSAVAPVLFTALLDWHVALPWVFLALVSVLAVPAAVTLKGRKPAS
ncbi:MFS transporter [Streptomyces sp. ISL-100]|uniref:MFS transporter n=1 Tax=Streptomyces sp. ISL-100 TaxID=2819173 RepID=UPI0027E3E675|nr:MFS transporter [Streptomyces sp. ISL-100]